MNATEWQSCVSGDRSSNISYPVYCKKVAEDELKDPLKKLNIVNKSPIREESKRKDLCHWVDAPLAEDFPLKKLKAVESTATNFEDRLFNSATEDMAFISKESYSKETRKQSLSDEEEAHFRKKRKVVKEDEDVSRKRRMNNEDEAERVSKKFRLKINNKRSLNQEDTNTESSQTERFAKKIKQKSSDGKDAHKRYLPEEKNRTQTSYPSRKRTKTSEMQDK